MSHYSDEKGGQAFLLSDSALRAARYSTFENFQPAVSIGASELETWKHRVLRFQAHERSAATLHQGTLFEALALETSALPENAQAENAQAKWSNASSDLAASIDPFSLRRQNTEFWRWHFEDVGVPAMYFVMDYTFKTQTGQPLLLYIGETLKSNQRWKGEHDCKGYLLSYRQAHYDHQLDSEVAIAFWPHAPAKRRQRQALESALIGRWRSPFNKENWRFWNTPFVQASDAL